MNPEKSFRNYLNENLKSKRIKAADLEDVIKVMYEKWLHAPNAELGGETPYEFFTTSSDSKKLLEAALETIRDGGEPDALIGERLTELDGARDYLLRILKKGDAYQKRYAAKVLSSKKMLPISRFLDIALAEEEDGELREIVIDALKESADIITNELYSRAFSANIESKKIIAEIASSSAKGDDRFLELVTEIMYSGEVAFAAHMFVRYGDERAVYVMLPLIQTADYADYIELRSAVISLGGEVEEERDFSDDEVRAEISFKTKGQSEE
ncbi:MAG: DUF2384 domain-containing protein [Clostridia bacterium]|nr:DUF2384 domain-containing protein [Clostridia bacterium]